MCKKQQIKTSLDEFSNAELLYFYDEWMVSDLSEFGNSSMTSSMTKPFGHDINIVRQEILDRMNQTPVFGFGETM